ncbi:MAG TPA: amino acid permease [Actinocrinis sp.]|nr:amino acid permease [Actinocrinis sp.]
MSAPTHAAVPVDSVAAADLATLHALGYPQQLHRRMGRFGAFAVPLSTTSVLTGVPAMFAFAMLVGGPAPLVWSWIVLGPLVLVVAYAMAEICSAYPASGALYYWSDKLAVKHKKLASWVTAWLNGLGQVAGTAGATFSMALFTGAFLNFKWNVTVTPGLTFSIFLALLVACALLNSLAVRLVMRLNEVSVIVHVAGVAVIALCLALIPAHHQTARFVTGAVVNDTGFGHTWYVWLLAPLTLMYTMTGIDAPGHMSEETENATFNAPNAMVKSVLSTWALGFVLILALLFAIQPGKYSSEAGGSFGVAPASIMVDALPASVATLLIAWLLVGQFFCVVACLTATSRQFYGAGRDAVYPGGRWLHSTSRRTRVPVKAVWVAVVLMALIGLPAYLVSVTFFLAITSVASAALFLSYIIPVYLRLKAGRAFTPGEYKIPAPRVFAALAVLYVVAAAVLACLPLSFPVTRADFNWAPVMIAIALVGVLAWFALGGRRTYTGPRRYTAEQIEAIEAEVF